MSATTSMSAAIPIPTAFRSPRTAYDDVAYNVDSSGDVDYEGFVIVDYPSGGSVSTHRIWYVTNSYGSPGNADTIYNPDYYYAVYVCNVAFSGETGVGIVIASNSAGSTGDNIKKDSYGVALRVPIMTTALVVCMACGLMAASLAQVLVLPTALRSPYVYFISTNLKHAYGVNSDGDVVHGDVGADIDFVDNSDGRD